MKINLFVLIALISGNAFSQTSTLLQRMEFKLSYSQVNSRMIGPDYNTQPVQLYEKKYPNLSQYGIQGTYLLNRYVRGGLYFSYAKPSFIDVKPVLYSPDIYTYPMFKDGTAFFYGLNLDLQLLPLFTKIDNVRLQAYVPVQLGLVSEKIINHDTRMSSWRNPVTEYSVGLGLTYYVFKHVGVFCEYRRGHLFNDRSSQWKLGMSVHL